MIRILYEKYQRLTKSEMFMTTVIFIINELLMQISTIQLLTTAEVANVDSSFQFLTVDEYLRATKQTCASDLQLLLCAGEGDVLRYGRIVPSILLQHDLIKRVTFTTLS